MFKQFFLFLFFLTLLFSQFTRETDSLALVDLYQSTDGENWKVNTNWLNGSSIDNWFGVTFENGRVTKLNILNNDVSGLLPNSIGNLTALTFLGIGSGLTGSIPTSIGNLTNIEEIRLSANDLSGSIPASIGNLTKLKRLWLSNNNLVGPIPLELWNIGSSLEQLYLQDNSLTGSIPSNIGNLSSLEYLRLYRNLLTGEIPVELGNLSSLKTLELYENQLTGSVPIELGYLSLLKTLRLDKNQLTGVIPSSFDSLKNVVTLYLNDNQISGLIPKELGSLSTLVKLWLHNNNLTGPIPSELGNIGTNLTQLYLFGNNLTDTIPSSLGRLTSVTHLQLNNNSLTGALPSEFQKLTQLERIDVSNNKLSGSIPDIFQNLTALNYILLDSNNITDSLPSSITSASSLRDIVLNANKLSYIPDISSLNNLVIVRVQDNKLQFNSLENNLPVFATASYYSPQDSVGEQKSINRYIGSKVVLSVDVAGVNNQYQWYKNGSSILGADSSSYLIMSLENEDVATYHCEISNSLVTGLSLQSRKIILNAETNFRLEDSLALVDLYNATNGEDWTTNTNWLSNNPIDTWFGITVSDGRVMNIDMPSNNMTGSLPSSISNLSELFRITLDHNNLNGSLPSNIGNLTKLTYLHMGFNNFSGSIPTSISTINTLVNIWLNNNSLSGSIPSELGNLTAIESLNLSKNFLRGSIPAELGNLSTLKSLQIAHNPISGSIPAELGNLTLLQSLNLANDSLSGFIPTELGNLESLKSLYLDRNQLEGSIPKEFGLFSDLTTLSLYSNQLSDSIPSELGNLSTLTDLKLSSNKLISSIPQSFESLSALQTLYLANNNLSGKIPSIFQNLTALKDIRLENNFFTDSLPSDIIEAHSLETIVVRGNQLSYLPNLSTLVNLDRLNIEQNQFQFESLEQNSALALGNYTYSPQDSVGESISISQNFGTMVTISVSVSGANNIYQWYRNDVLLTGENSSDLNIAYLEHRDLATYHCKITNTLVNDLTLYSRPIHLLGFDNTAPAAVSLQGSAGDSEVQLTWTENADADFQDYILYQVLDEDTTTVDTVTNQTSVSKTIQRLTNYRSYSFYILVRDTNNNKSIESNTVVLEPQDLTSPQAVTLSSANARIGAIDLVWTMSDADDFAQYLIYRESGGENGIIDTVKLQSSLSYSDESALASVDYRYAIIVEDIHRNKSDTSNFRSAIWEEAKPQLSISVFQNPVTLNYLDILVISDIDLKSDNSIQVNDSNISLSQLHSKTLKTSYRVTESGELFISADISAENNEEAHVERRFQVVLVEDKSNVANLEAIRVSNLPNKSMLLLEKSENSFKLELNKSLNNELCIEFDVNSEFSDLSKLFIAHKDNGIWSNLPTQIFSDKRTARIYTRELGEFRFQIDPSFKGNNVVPKQFLLEQNYPNPFNPSTTISYKLAQDGYFKILIFNSLGQMIRTIENEYKLAGSYQTRWDGKNDYGVAVSSGFYFYQLQTANKVISKKMILLK